MGNAMEHVFVYGTLKRGQCREGSWPKAAALIRSAWTRGQLLDLGPYPALVVGDDRVRGELWSFAADDMATVVNRLDRIEVTNQPGLVNEYDRVSVAVTLDNGQTLSAQAYRLSDQQPAPALRPMAASVVVVGQPYVVWPASVGTVI